MGELILCSRMPAAVPYYIDSVSLHVYSLEELSYYIEKNLYLLGQDFVSEELCTWIERELHFGELAGQLREIYRGGSSLSEFVGCILKASGYHGTREVAQMLAVLRDMEQKSEYECRKLRADRYLETHRYIHAIYEYRKLLEMKEEDAVLVGNVWHNLGTACASMFLFREAAIYFGRAYERNRNPESLRECLYACCCMNDEKQFGQTADAAKMTAKERDEVKETLALARRMPDIVDFEARIDAWTKEGQRDEIAALLEEWKDIYRKNCRI